MTTKNASRLTAIVLATSAAIAAAAQTQKPSIGYQDTPLLPGGKWHVHDGTRPQPRIVTPGPSGAPVAPPSDAVVLFNGTDLSAWQHEGGTPAKWKIDAGAMVVEPMTGTLETKQQFGDCQLHVEFATPVLVRGDGQGRGNSGVFLMGLYEIQVLDSYENPTYPDGQAAAIYGQFPPLVNASRKPGEWQTFDIFFTAPRFQANTLVTPAYATVIHNGILVQDHMAIMGATVHRALATYQPHGPTGPVKLQDHGNPMRFRSIWVRPL
jgi:hypothetical protein